MMANISTSHEELDSQDRSIYRKSISRERVWLAFIVVGAFIGLYLGWRLFWYLTDDAFIAFRYVSNSLLGYGYVWNPPPFKPVEGYTSFLWVLILDGIWRMFGVMPPDSANWISLIFSYITLIISMVMVYKLEWRPGFRKYRLLFLVMFLVAVLANRTFLAWTSSGLETAMFNFFILYWVFSTFYLKTGSRVWLWNVSVSATLLALTRPDGLLFITATLFMMTEVLYLRWKKSLFLPGDIWSLLPMTLIPLHVLWRFHTYGEWLPNTYYAKASPDLFWVTSGIYYVLSFVIEYSFWFFMAFVAMYSMQLLRRWRGSGFHPVSSFFESHNFVKLVSFSALFLHFVYYTFVIGGDHFEFRVYSHLIVLIFLSAVWLLIRITSNPKVALISYLIFVLASLPIPWINWFESQKITNRFDAVGMAVSVADVVQNNAPYTPGLMISYLRFYDTLQSWLVHHFVCVRQQEHKLFWQSVINEYPSREDGSLITDDGFPVVQRRSIGVLAWVLPHVNVIDKWGLNDYVVARNPDLDPAMLMAHLRQPPEGYVECFEPNVLISNRTATVFPRAEPMTAERIKACEEKFILQMNEATPK